MARRLGAVGMSGGPRVAIAVLAALVLTASCAAPASPSPRLAPATPASSASSAVSATTGSLLARIRSPEFGPDSEAAVVEALAAGGIGTYRDPSQSSPILTLSVAASPLRSTVDQVHALEHDAMNGGALTGAAH